MAKKRELQYIIDGYVGSKFHKAIATVERKMKSLDKVGKTLTKAVTLPVVAGLAQATRTFASFEQAMNRVTALTGASGDQFDALKKQALELGRTTQFSASEAANAMGFLAMAGFKAEEIIGAMPSTLQLAAAAQMDLAQAADITSNIMTGYSKSVDELGYVNDVLSKAFTSANMDLSMLGESMKYAGPLASGMGVAFEEAAAAIGLMGGAGIQGSMAGTSLRGIIDRLGKSTGAAAKYMAKLGISTKDSSGKLRSIVDIVRQFEKSNASASDVMEIFGQRAGPAMLALLEAGSDKLADFTQNLRDSEGTAKRLADVQMAGIAGQFKALSSAAEGLGIVIGETIAPHVQKGAEWLTTMVQKLNEMPEGTRNMAVIASVIAAAVGPALVIIAKAVMSVKSAVVVLAKVLPVLRVAMSGAFLTSPIGLVLIAITAVIAIVVLLVRHWDTVKAAMVGAWEWFLRFGTEGLGRFIPVVALVSAIATNWDTVSAALKVAWDWLKKVAGVLSGPFAGAWGTVKSAVSAVWDILKKIQGAISKVLENPFVRKQLGLKQLQPRENGGPVQGGRPYLVGERGPELFTPGRSGSIIPNLALAGGGGISIGEINITMPGGSSADRPSAVQVGDAVVEAIRRFERDQRRRSFA